eukprot:4231536-Ditylum_brightwellii.AAC.1
MIQRPCQNNVEILRANLGKRVGIQLRGNGQFIDGKVTRVLGDAMVILSAGGSEISSGLAKTTGGIPTAIPIADIALITGGDETGFITDISEEIESADEAPEEWLLEYRGLG